MTNTPGQGETPEDPYSRPQSSDPDAADEPTQPYGQQPGRTSGEQPGYWEQQAQGEYAQQQSGQFGQGYGQYGYAPAAPPQYAPDHPKSTTVLVLGILGIVLCGLIAPFAWAMGKRTVAEIDASGGQVGGRGAANAGYILGIVGTILLILSVVFFVFVIGIMGLSVITQSGVTTY